jgi:ABC-type lipoprotein export system ATPase subunit
MQFDWISYFYWNNILFENLSINFSDKWIYSILWPSWSWKSTLISCISSYNTPKSWKIFYKDDSIFWFNSSKLLNYRTSIIWISYQKFYLIDDFSVLDNITLWGYITKNTFDKNWFEYIVNYFWIEKLVKRKLSSLSWWENARVSLCKSVVYKPKILLLDEPTSYLNIENKNKIYTFIDEYSKNNLCLVNTHETDFNDFFSLKFLQKNCNLDFYWPSCC